MTKQKISSVPRRRSGRAAVLVGATLALLLSAVPGAHADDGTGVLGGITQAVGQTTEPVVQPVVEAVQSAVPEPVSQTVAPVVEQVVEPVQPVAQVVEQVVRHVEVQAESSVEDQAPALPVHHVDERAEGPTKDPAGTPARGPVGQPAPAAVDPVEPGENAVAHHPPAAGAPTGGGHAGDWSDHDGAPGPVAVSCPDLPPRVAPASGVARHRAGHDVSTGLTPQAAAGEVGEPDVMAEPRDGEGGGTFALPRRAATAVPALPGPSSFPVLGLAGLLALLVAAGMALIAVRELRASVSQP